MFSCREAKCARLLVTLDTRKTLAILRVLHPVVLRWNQNLLSLPLSLHAITSALLDIMHLELEPLAQRIVSSVPRARGLHRVRPLALLVALETTIPRQLWPRALQFVRSAPGVHGLPLLLQVRVLRAALVIIQVQKDQQSIHVPSV